MHVHLPAEHTDSHPYSPFTDADSDIVAYINTNGNGNSHGFCYVDSYSYTYIQANAHPPSQPNTQDTAYPTTAHVAYVYEEETHSSIRLRSSRRSDLVGNCLCSKYVRLCKHHHSHKYK